MAEHGAHCMEIQIKDIPHSGKDYTFEVPPDSIDLPKGVASLNSSVKTEVHCTRRETDVYIVGNSRASFWTECSRCLENTALNLRVKLEGYFQQISTEKMALSEEVGEEDVGYYYYNNNQIDLLPMIAEILVLDLPTYPLCDLNCQGICPECGRNKNRDTCSCGNPQEHQGNPFKSFFQNED
ncbi:MAG: DUF177 domain-containing protein [Planctomycetota bacterium]|jgi:uncharacterized protein|nr:DUF177 domain-containing protein [Planctomycetota bacterium]